MVAAIKKPYIAITLAGLLVAALLYLGLNTVRRPETPIIRSSKLDKLASAIQRRATLATLKCALI